MALIIATTEATLAELLASIEGSDRIGIDIEGNGLFAYRSDLCAVQLSWLQPDGEVGIGIVDPFSVDVDGLASLLSDDGPLKILHDLTFDARLLHETGIRLGHVHDTSVMAQLLGEPKSGLATLVEKHFGVSLSKSLQDHDWARRPFTDAQLAYLCQDVRYLLELDKRMCRTVAERGIVSEVATECAYKLSTALAPPRDQRPPHERVKGYKSLKPRQRAVLFRLTEARERIAQEQDRPPFRIAPSGLLLEMARRMPSNKQAIIRMCRKPAIFRHADSWLNAIHQGMRDEPLAPRRSPDSPPPLSGAEQALRKNLKKGLVEWRKREAERRGFPLQVIIPGHCMDKVCDVIASYRDDTSATLDALSAIEGLGDARIDRYLGTWTAFAASQGER